MSEINNTLPVGKTCRDCFHWHRCNALGYSPGPYQKRCDFSPSRFVYPKTVPKASIGDGDGMAKVVAKDTDMKAERYTDPFQPETNEHPLDKLLRNAIPKSDTPRTDAAEEYIKKLYHLSNLVSATKMRELERENTRLREGISRICSSIGNGSAASPNASMEFLCDCVADEVLQYCDHLRGEVARLREALAKNLEAARVSFVICPALDDIKDQCEDALKGGKP